VIAQIDAKEVDDAMMMMFSIIDSSSALAVVGLCFVGVKNMP
jgi:hypothetical protein